MLKVTVTAGSKSIEMPPLESGQRASMFDHKTSTLLIFSCYDDYAEIHRSLEGAAIEFDTIRAISSSKTRAEATLHNSETTDIDITSKSGKVNLHFEFENKSLVTH